MRNRRRGLALVEVLICASIAAMMLTTTAIAFRASVAAFPGQLGSEHVAFAWTDRNAAAHQRNPPGRRSRAHQ
jgi:hypothetical protein